MSPFLLVAVALAGGVGAAARFVLDGAITRRWPARLPVGTLVINVSGSLLLGVVTGASHALGATAVAVIGTGVMGGYTTFSTASFETVRLLRAARPIAAAVFGLGMLVVAVAAAAVGILLGGLV